MIDECVACNIDHVITKSISRFARNTLDCLKYIRQLKEKNILVYFKKVNINSMDSKGEVMQTIMASLAQQESQSLSHSVNVDNYVIAIISLIFASEFNEIIIVNICMIVVKN